MHWMWINVSILVVFTGLWLWKGVNYVGQNKLKRLMSKIVSVAILGDGALTLIVQRAQYWSDFSNVNEAAVIGRALLSWHSLSFTLGIICWAIFACFVIHKVSGLFSYTAFFALFLGHSLGVWNRFGHLTADWIFFIHPELRQYLFYVFLGLVIAIVIEYARRLKP